MKGIKKLLTGILAGAMAFTMALSAGNATQVQAAADGKITVSNTTENQTYELYKVFDATYSGSNIAYSYTKKGDSDPFFAALTDDTKSPFTLTSYGEAYNVVRKEGVSNDAILDFIRANGPVKKNDGTWTAGNFGDAVQTKTGNGSSISFTGLDYGYYFIKSSLGAVVTIDSAVKEASVIDKNQKITIDKQEAVDKDNNGDLKWEYRGQGIPEGTTTPTQAVGSKVNYKLTGTVTQYSGEYKVTFLKFVDTMTEGLTPDKNVKIEIDGDDVTDNGTVTVTYDDAKNQTTIVVKTVDGDNNFLYDANAEYVITYSATVNEKALNNVQNNEVVLYDSQETEVGKDKTEVTNFNITLEKKDGKTKDFLAGAEFKLYTAKTAGTEVGVVLVTSDDDDETYGTKDSTVDNVYRVAKEDETPVETMVTGKTGKIVVKGLKNGSYFFEETKAPLGYNRLTERTDAANINNSNVTLPVDNYSGLELPETGGIGTTIFYIVGGILIIAGVAYFMVRRKSSAK